MTALAGRLAWWLEGVCRRKVDHMMEWLGPINCTVNYREWKRRQARWEQFRVWALWTTWMTLMLFVTALLFAALTGKLVF